MDDIEKNLSITHAEEIYNTALAGSVLSRSNPSCIENEITFLKDFYSKLKFQYLEQEARDKFISYSFFKDLDLISQSDIDELAKTDATAKEQLRILEQDLTTAVERNKESAEEVIEMYHMFKQEKSKCTKAADELESLKAELEQLMSAPENESCALLFDLNKTLETPVFDPMDAFQMSEAKHDHNELLLQELSRKEEALTTEKASIEKLRVELEDKLQTLENHLHQISEISENSSPDPEQTEAQRLQHLIPSINIITGKPLEVRKKDQHYELLYNGKTVTFDKKLHIISASEGSLTPSEIHRINIASMSGDPSKFPELLTKMLLDKD